MIVVDLGDFVDCWYLLLEVMNGQVNILLMNEVGYDVVMIGNNEGVGNFKEDLNYLYDYVEFDIIFDNLFDKNMLQLLIWMKLYKIIIMKYQIKIGLIVFIVLFLFMYNLNGWDICNLYDILLELVEDLCL